MLLQLKVDCQELKRVFSIVSKSVRVQDTILSNILLTVNPEEIGFPENVANGSEGIPYKVYLHARNVSWSVTSLLTPSFVELDQSVRSFAVLIDSKILGLILKPVKKNSTGEVKIEIIDTKNGVIEYQGDMLKFSILSNAAFPEVSRERRGEVRGFEIMSSELLTGLRDGSRGCSSNFREKIPPYIHEILFEVSADMLRLVSTDGKRLATRDVELKSSTGEYKFSVKDSSVNELIRLLEKYKVDDIILVSKDDYDVYFVLHQGNTVYKTFAEANSSMSDMLNDGERFPNYRRIIPERFSSVVRVNKSELNEALIAVQGIVGKKSSWEVFCRISGNGIKISGKCDGREIVRDVPVASLVGNGFYIAYNVNYLLDGLVPFRDDEQVVIKLTDENSLSLFINEGTGYRYLLAPVRFGTDFLIDGIDDELKKQLEAAKDKMR